MNSNTFELSPIILFDLSQCNNEYKCHHFFNGNLYMNDLNTSIDHTLFQLIKEPLKQILTDKDRQYYNNSRVSFSDNSNAIDGYRVPNLKQKIDRSTINQIDEVKYFLKDDKINFISYTKTYNFSNSVASLQGEVIEIDKRLQNIQAIGIGGIPITGSVGYYVDELSLNDENYSKNVISPIDSLIDASNKISKYGNKYGEPVIVGFARSHRSVDQNNKSTEWTTPVIFTGGIGFVKEEHLYKKDIKSEMIIAKLGSPVYRSGQVEPYMKQKMNRVIRSCIDMGDENPIISIHVQGISNILKEITEDMMVDIYLDGLTLGEDSLSYVEKWISLYNESNILIIPKKSIQLIEKLCDREGVIFDIIGKVLDKPTIDNTEPPYINIYHNNELIVTKYSYKEHLIEKQKYILRKPDPILTQFQSSIDYNSLSLKACLSDVLTQLDVGSKRFLTNKVDRSVTGLIAQQQCVGSQQTPLSNYGLISNSYFPDSDTKRFSGCVTAIGEQPIYSLIDPIAMVNKTVAELLTNIMWVKIDGGLKNIRCSTNWTATSSTTIPEEGYKIYTAVKELSRLCIELGIAIDGNNENLSTSYEQSIKSPDSLILTGYGPCSNINKKVTPDIKLTTSSILVFIDLSKYHPQLDQDEPVNIAMGGSILAQTQKQLYSDKNVPILRNINNLKITFDIIQDLIEKDTILSGHDKSDGGLITTLLEMAFAGNKGLNIIIPDAYKNNVIEFLFNEEVGIVIEIKTNKLEEIRHKFTKHGIACYRIAKITSKDLIDINYEIPDQKKYKEPYFIDKITNFKMMWESTSFKLEKYQCVEKYVEKEHKCLNSMIPMLVGNLPNNFSLPVKLPYLQDDNHNHKPKYKVAIIREEGSNSDREMSAAFYHAGFEVIDYNMYDLDQSTINLDNIRGLVFVGGFSHSYVLGSAKGWYTLIQNNPIIYNKLNNFKQRDNTFILGVGNGCQLLVKLGWLEEDEMYHDAFSTSTIIDTCSSTDLTIKLKHNRSGRFESRFSQILVESSNSIFFNEYLLDSMNLGMWVAHAEGRFSMSDDIAERLINMGRVPMVYSNSYGLNTTDYPHNPNGSTRGIASISSQNGRILAMIPQPERSFLNWQLPYIPNDIKTKLKNYIYSPWFNIFRNAYMWCNRTSKEKVAVIGLYTIVDILSQSPNIEHIYVIPGNSEVISGTYSNSNSKVHLLSNISITKDNFKELSDLLYTEEITKVIIGTEQLLVDGLVDYLKEHKNILCFGPSQEVVQIVESKIFAKEDKLSGDEVSVFGLCNGTSCILSPQVQNYKSFYDDDKGPNTNGMGTIAPVQILNKEDLLELQKNMNDIVKELDYVGILYVNIMKTSNGVYILKFNCGFNDQETQTVLNLIDNPQDFYHVMERCMYREHITDDMLQYKTGYVANVVLSHKDCLHSKLTTPIKITNQLTLEQMKHHNLKLYYENVSSSKTNHLELETTGGRVMSMVCYSETSLYDALNRIYNNIHKISYDGIYYRRDIGYKYINEQLQRQQQSHSSHNLLYKSDDRLRIAIIGSMNGNNIRELINRCQSNMINAKIEVFISNNEDDHILDRANIPNMFISQNDRTKEEYDDHLFNILKTFDIDIIYLVGYMKMIPSSIIEEYKGRIFKIHPSLLPKYSGLINNDVHHEVLKNHEFTTGCTLHEVTTENNHGRIMLQKQLIVDDCINPNVDIAVLAEQALITVTEQVQKMESQILIDFVNVYVVYIEKEKSLDFDERPDYTPLQDVISKMIKL
jgi:phosphoribosylformylglycinamidine synthase